MLYRTQETSRRAVRDFFVRAVSVLAPAARASQHRAELDLAAMSQHLRRDLGLDDADISTLVRRK